MSINNELYLSSEMSVWVYAREQKTTVDFLLMLLLFGSTNF